MSRRLVINHRYIIQPCNAMMVHTVNGSFKGHLPIIGQFNVHNIELALAAIMAAEAENAPIILAVGPSTFEYLGDISPLISAIHKMIRKATVPISLHLDHAKDFEMIKNALDLGFSSIMFDGSALPFDENVRLTAKAVELSHAYGASMEGEIGIIPAQEPSPNNISENFTNPEKAADFARETNIDLIAVSVGSVHGMQNQSSSIDCGLIKELSTKLSCPQVLHGASGVLDEYLSRSNKIRHQKDKHKHHAQSLFQGHCCQINQRYTRYRYAFGMGDWYECRF